MDVGTVTLNLGVPRDKVLAQIKQAGYKLLELAPEGKETKVAVTHRNIDNDMVERAMVLVDNDGELFFRDGTLVRIRKEVAASTINTDRDLAFSLYAIVKGLEKEGSSTSCSVRTVDESSALDEPGLEAKTIALTCSLSDGVYRTSYIRWTVAEKLRDQLHVVVFQDLWR